MTPNTLDPFLRGSRYAPVHTSMGMAERSSSPQPCGGPQNVVLFGCFAPVFGCINFIPPGFVAVVMQPVEGLDHAREGRASLPRGLEQRRAGGIARRSSPLAYRGEVDGGVSLGGGGRGGDGRCEVDY